MMRAAIMTFSERGQKMAAAISAALAEYETQIFRPKGNLMALTAELFPRVDALIFVGACGIAVRAIAPNLADKTRDPAVMVIDEQGTFVVSLLSGHIGGANDLTRQLALALGATPVITTATDVNHRFAADAWSASHGLMIEDMQAAKRFAAEILTRDLPVYSDFPILTPLPQGLVMGDSGSCGLMISCRHLYPFETTLLLIPRILHIGLGCRRGISPEAVERAVQSVLFNENISEQAICSAATIDIKRDEAGLTLWADAHHLPLSYFSAEELRQMPGTFSSSPFVEKTVGVDNVCERAAIRDAGAGSSLIVQKTSLDGVTVALAHEKWSVSFE